MWKSYTLVDTPGINGPSEDEKITLQEIQKHDIIMFVIDDSDNFDSDVITRRIVEIIEAKKPCLIVINRKNDRSDEEVANIRAKMKENISKLTNAEHSYEFFDVDARTALRGKRENKSLLLQSSKIAELEYRISKRLLEAEGVLQLRVPLDMMKVLCEHCRSDLNDTALSAEGKRLTKLQQKLFDTKDHIRQDFAIALGRKVDEYSRRIYENASVTGEIDLNKEQCERDIRSLAQNAFEKFSAECNESVHAFTDAVTLEMDISKIPDAPEITEACRIENKDDALDEILDVLSKIPVLTPIPGPIPIPIPVAIGILKSLKKLIFGSEERSIDDVDELNQQQEEYARKKELALRQLHNQISVQMDTFSASVMESFNAQLEETYQVYAQNIEKALTAIQGEAAQIAQRMERISEIESAVNVLIREIV